MKLLITGSNGFIGKNLIAELRNQGLKDIFEFDIDTKEQLLTTYCEQADFVFHLAGVNRPREPAQFMEGNFGFTSTLLDTLKKHKNTCPVMMASSTQATLDNPYGKSKKAGEALLFAYEKETDAKVFIYRFANVFGKWCKPNYNSAVATFCHNIANELEIVVHDPRLKMNLIYIDDLVNELINVLAASANQVDEFCEVQPVYEITLGEIVDLIYSFKKSRTDLSIANMADSFTRKLYSTYLSYLPTAGFSYPLRMHQDQRGSFTEFIKTADRGQISINICKPGITKGDHWHHTKSEKFLVVSGTGVIRFRRVDSDKIIEYFVSGEKLEVVDIPAGYTHNIENIGSSDLVTVMWVNEIFDHEKPDTYSLGV